MRGRDMFKRYKKWILLLSDFYGLFPAKTLKRKLAGIRKLPGTIALVKRYALLRALAKSIGDNVSIFSDVYLINPENIKIGNNVSIQPMTYIEAVGGVSIGSDVSIAEGVSMFSANHGYSDISIPIKDQELVLLPIVIEDNVWIGAKATILGGVTLSSGTIVAAGAVVHDSTEKNATVAGVPAKTIKIRK